MNDSGMIVLLTLCLVMIFSIICNICQMRRARAQFEEFIYDYLKEESAITNRLLDVTTAVVASQHRMREKRDER